MQAQVDTHQQLRALTESYVQDTKGKTTMPEMHTRHVATVALATIKEHVQLSKMLLDYITYVRISKATYNYLGG